MPAKQHRVTRGDDYRRIVRTGRRVGGATCITHAVFHSPNAPARFGFIISKAVGNAVIRNLVRRRMKGIVREQLQAGLSGVDVVFRALPASAAASYVDLRADISRALQRLEAHRDTEVSQ